jgi:hypothetical protein
MSGGWLGRIAILLLVDVVMVTPANAVGPDDAFKRSADESFNTPMVRCASKHRGSLPDPISPTMTPALKRRDQASR